MAGTVQVVTQNENPNGRVLVVAVAEESKLGDGRPIAGFYYQRRYHGQQFRIEKPQEFSPRWMRFVEEPPADWADKLKAYDLDTKKFAKLDAKEFVADPNEIFAMSQAQGRENGVMNYANGRVTARRNA